MVYHEWDTDQESPGVDHDADTHAVVAATDPEPPGDQSPEVGPSTSEQHQPEEFPTLGFQDIDLPDIDASDNDLPDLSHTGELPTLNLQDLDIPGFNWAEPS